MSVPSANFHVASWQLTSQAAIKVPHIYQHRDLVLSSNEEICHELTEKLEVMQPQNGLTKQCSAPREQYMKGVDDIGTSAIDPVKSNRDDQYKLAKQPAKILHRPKLDYHQTYPEATQNTAKTSVSLLGLPRLTTHTLTHYGPITP